MSDIVERLRTMAVEGMHSWPDFEREADKHALEDAADEFTRLRAEVAKLREVLAMARKHFVPSIGPTSGISRRIERVEHALTSTAPTAEAHDRRVRNKALEEAAKVADAAPTCDITVNILIAETIRSLIQEGE
jgi:hypothetical protein